MKRNIMSFNGFRDKLTHGQEASFQHSQAATFGFYSASSAVMCVSNLRKPEAPGEQENQALGVECLLSLQKTMRDKTKAATLRFVFPSMQPFNTLPIHFRHNRKQCLASSATNQLSLCKSIYTCKTVWVNEPSEQSVLRNRGKFPCLGARHCSVASKVNACGWKTESTELCLSVLVEKHPSTNRPTASCQGGSYKKKIFTYREHNNSPAGDQTLLHFTRYLLWAESSKVIFYPAFSKQWEM